MLWMFFLHSAAYWLCMPVRAFIMISSFSGVKRYFVKRKNILLCLDKKTWRCGQRFGGLKPMLRSASAVCAPEPTRNVILRRRHRPRESQRKSSTLWFTILRCYSMITQDEIYHGGSKDTRFFTRSSISRTETVSSTVTLFIIWHVTQSKQIIPSPRAKYKSRAGGCWCTCRAQ